MSSMMRLISILLAVLPFLGVGNALTWGRIVNVTQPCIFHGPTGYASLANITSFGNCSGIIISGLKVPAGVTLSLRNLKNTSVTFQGETSWGYQEWAGPLLIIEGNNVTVKGAPGSVLNGTGELWWDGEGSDGKTKPKFFKLKLTNSTVDDIRILNSPVHVFSINNCRNLTLANITIDNSLGDKRGGHNTDGFDISESSDITIAGAKVYNQDDCVAINSGTNIVFRNGTCVGGHGLSVGSVGGRTNNVVSNVLFEDSLIADSENGVRIKTKSGESGTVSNVTYKNIRLENITKIGITVDQSYGATSKAPTNGIPVTNFTLVNITGTVIAKGTNIFVNCGNSSSCESWSWSGVHVTGGNKTKKCLNLPVGISCS
ncbi:glycoside hydrolase family 28 protein [Rhypophila sp. PSN 637]